MIYFYDIQKSIPEFPQTKKHRGNGFVVSLLFMFFFFILQELYFVGQYAAPVTCLGEMKEWKIAGVNDDTIGLEAERFYGIVSQLMKNAAPDQAQFCEFIYYDGR